MSYYFKELNILKYGVNINKAVNWDTKKGEKFEVKIFEERGKKDTKRERKRRENGKEKENERKVQQMKK